MLNDLWHRICAILRQGRLETELDEELSVHLEDQIKKFIQAGMPRDEAMRRARIDFGGLDQVKEECRDARGVKLISTIIQDIRFGLRMLRRSPGFAATSVLTLALGIGATGLLFSIFDGAYIHFPGPSHGRKLVIVSQKFPTQETETLRFSSAEYFDIARPRKSFDGFFPVGHWMPTLTEPAEQGTSPERVPVVRISAVFFPLYGIPPILGRTFSSDEDRPGGPNVAVVTYRLWNGRFGRNQAIVGKVISLDHNPYSVIGVLPEGFQEWGADIYIPFRLDPASTNRTERTMNVAGVVSEGASTSQTESALRDLAREVETQHVAANPEYKGLIYAPMDVREIVVGDLRTALYVLLGAVALLLLITSANIANLLLARTRARAREIGTRLALGATPLRLARQFMTESIMLALAACVLGLILGFSALRPVLSMIPDHFIGEGSNIYASPTAFLIGISSALILGIGFGFAPSLLILRRGGAGNLTRTRTTEASGHRGGRARTLLVLSEMALAFMVITGAGLMFRTYKQLSTLDLGFQADHVLTMRIALAETKYPGGIRVSNFFLELMRRVRSLPGIAGVAAASIRPMEGYALRDFSFPGRALNTASGMATADFRVITPEYFSVIRTPLRVGRPFAEQDTPDAPHVAIVNESFARLYFFRESVLNKRIKLENSYYSRIPGSTSSSGDVVQIIGVVADSRQLSQWSPMRDLYEPASPEIFVPLLQHPENGQDMGLLVRTRPDAAGMTDAVRQQVLGVDSDQPVYDIETLRHMADLTLGPAHLCLLLLGIFAATAMLTACLGLHAIVSYSVSQRTQEIGIRMALGASRSDVLRTVLKEGMGAVAAGLIIGLAGSLGVARVMSSILFRVPATDLMTLAVVSATLALVALLAAYVPARRATRIEPMSALRYE